MRKSLAAGFILLAAVAPAIGADSGGEVPALIDYGKWASPRQGDNDHHQVIYLSVPATATGKLYVRIFDPDTGGAYDQIDKRFINSTTRFAVFGGEGAIVTPTNPEELSKEEMTAGTLIGEKIFRRDRKVDGTWQTIAEVDPAQGARDGDRLFFRLLVDATGGVNGNVFDVAVSTAPDANVAPEGLRLYSYTSTARMPRRGVLTELKFAIPPGTRSLRIGNFDAAYGTAFLTTKFVSYPLLASGQGDWKETSIELPDDDTEAAVTLSGGREYPNDATFYVTDQDGKPLPFELPPKVLPLNGRPHAIAEQDPMGSCTSVRFAGGLSSDPEGDPLSYRWRFGDGQFATGPSAIHNYAEDGHYTAALEVTDGNAQFGNGSVATLPVFVKRPPVAKSDKRTSFAAGETVAFDGTPSTASKWRIAANEWDFGDGQKATGDRVEHAWPKPGTYTITHKVTDDSGHPCNNASEQFTVRVNAEPVAVAGADRRIAVREETILDASASSDPDGRISAYAWDFGDGETATGAVVKHAYAKPATYIVKLHVADNSNVANSGADDQLTVIVNDPPVPEAGLDQSSAIDETLAFDAGASIDRDGTITAYDWDFGDGARASGEKVVHAYAKSGTYIVTLTVTDDSGTKTQSVSDTLKVRVNQPPVAAAGKDQGVAIGEETFFDGSASSDSDGRIISYDWDFGDGTRASGATVSHAYAKSGTYTATLTVTDDSGTRTRAVSDTASIRVNEPPVAVAGPDQLVTASEVQFDGSASSDKDDSISAWAWDFGDGKTGEGPKPRHVYERPGTYDVKLVVTDASKTIRNTAEDHLTVIVNAIPIADAGPDLVGVPGESLVFNAGRSLDPDGSIAEYDWDFRDGTTATGKSVKHAFARPGTYAVRLKVADNTGQPAAVDYSQTSVFINAEPVADAGPAIASVPGAEVHLSAAGSYDTDGRIIGYRWDFSDQKEPVDGETVTRVFKEPGVYTARLTVTDDSGAGNAIATDTVTISINHQPVANAGRDILTASSTITFDGTKSVDADGNALAYSWDFGDGATGAGPRVSHTYVAGGTYPVILTVDDGTGLANAKSTAAISVRINRPPVAVAGENRRVCTGDVVVLDGSRSSDPEGGVLKYAWTFGDGTGADIVNPTKTYRKGGTYPVTLTVKDDSGLANDTSASQIAVRVDQGPIARAPASILACAGTETIFDGSASTDVDGVVNGYSWDFGDGGSGGGEKPAHIYDKPGTYRAFLRIEGEKIGICDSSSSTEIAVRVIAGPVAAIKAPAAVPLGQPATFDGTGSTAENSRITGWHWDFGDGTNAEGTTASHVYAQPGTYQAALTLLSDSEAPSCRQVSARHVININAPPVADGGNDKVVAVDQETIFDASASHDPDGSISAYHWDFGDGTSADGIHNAHRYRKAGTYVAKLTVDDGAGLANSAATAEIKVTVNPPPAPAISGPAVACVGESVAWKAGSNAADYAWSFGDGASASTAYAAHAYRKPGRYSLALLEDDGKGLANSRQLATRMIHVNQPPRADAGPDRRACPGSAVTFDASGSADPDGKLIAYKWDFGDGAAMDGEKVVHAFDRPGTYAVKLTVTDHAGSSCSAATDGATIVVDAPPVADAGKDREVFIGGANDAVLLDGSASNDPDGEALTHIWTIGDGASEQGERVRHTFLAAGDYPVTLTVSDTSGLACGTASTTVHILARQR